jgi:hypothetical protein
MPDFQPVQKPYQYDVTLNPHSHMLYITRMAMAKHFFQHPLIRVSYAPAMRAIGLTPTAQKGRDTWAVYHKTRGTGELSLRALFRQNQLSLKQPVRADLQQADNGTLYFVIPEEAIATETPNE